MIRLVRAGVLTAVLSTLLALPGCYVEAVAPGPPPPPRVVVMPARPGHVWVRGHWAWRGGRWVWTNGRYERVRHGYKWMPGHWQPTNRGHRWVPGRWVRI
jgi:hypothetical protein